MMNMLTEGSQVQLVVQNLSRRHTWDPETVQFAGQVVKNLRGLDADQVCVTTDDPLFPVRIINKKRILSVITGGGIPAALLLARNMDMHRKGRLSPRPTPEGTY